MDHNLGSLQENPHGVNHVQGMKHHIAALAALLLMGALPAQAAGRDPAILSTVNGLVGATSANSAALVGSYFTADAVVIDESAPFVWRGIGAGAAWWRHIQTVVGRGRLRATASAPTELRTDRAGSDAYVVVPLRITVTANGSAHTETGLWALTMRRSGPTWKITTASWATLRR